MGDALSSDSATVLFVDDDADVLTAARVLLTRAGYRMLAAQSPAETWSLLAGEAVDVILLDLNFSRGATSGAEGFEWLAEIRAHDADAVVVVVTGHSGVNIAVAAMKAGASDFVMKPWSNTRLLETVKAAHALRVQRRRAASHEGSASVDEELLIIGESPAIQRVRDRINRVAPTDAAVLLLGEAGSGKGLAARVLHARSARAGRPFVRLDVRGLAPDNGAALGRAVAEADGGTLFLDEISALPPAAQAELSALIEGRANVRLVSATRAGRDGLAGVRDDLLSRLETVEIAMPPLAERGEDAVLLADHFVRLFSRRYGRAPKPLSPDAVQGLKDGPPAGGVRGLRQAVERAVVLGEGDMLTAADLAPPTASSATSAATSTDLNLARSEKAIVGAALKRHGHNVSKAAKELGLTRAALYRRMVKHGL